MTTNAYQQVPTFLQDEKQHRTIIAQALNGAIQGKTNNTGTLTLRANQTTTTVVDPRAGNISTILLSPRTANAAGATANTYVSSKLNGSFILTHANTAATDKTFDYTVTG